MEVCAGERLAKVVPIVAIKQGAKNFNVNWASSVLPVMSSRRVCPRTGMECAFKNQSERDNRENQ
jgi:hypothetical protein